jgi:hypothetical protein
MPETYHLGMAYTIHKKKHILVMVHYWVSHIALLYSQYSKIYILATLATRRLTSRALQNQARDAVEL